MSRSLRLVKAARHLAARNRRLEASLEAARRSEEGFRVTLDSIGDAVIATDRHGVITLINPVAQELTGWSPQEALGRPLSEVFCILDALTRQAIEDPTRKALALGERVAMSNHTVLVARDGREYQIANSAAPIRSPGGDVVGAVMVFRDETARISAQNALRQSEALTHALLDQSHQLFILLEPDGCILRMNRATLAFAGMTLEQVVGRPFWEMPWWPGREEAVVLFRRALDCALQGAVFQHEALCRDAAGRERIVAASIAPFVDGAGAVQYLIVGGYDITEMRRAEEAMRESESKYRTIFSNAPIAIFRSSFAGRLLEANPAMARMLGFSSREDLLASVTDLSTDIYPDPPARQRLLDALMASPGGVKREIEFRRRDGTPFYGVINTSLQMDADGRPAYLDGTIEDITERKDAEDALRLSQQRLRLFLDASTDLCFLKDLDLRYQLVNAANAAFFGRAGADILGKTDFDLMPEAAAAACGWSDRQAIQERRTVITAETVGDRVYETRKFPVVVDGVVVGVAGIIRDMTESVRAQEALRASGETFRALTENSHDTIMRFDPEGRHLYVNPAVESHTGIAPQEFLGRTHEELGFPPDLCRLWGDAIRRVFETKQVQRTEFQLPKGIWIDWLLMPEFDKQGEVTAVLASSRDVTERRQSEGELRRLAAAMEQSGEVVVITDPQGTIQYVNPAFERVTGYSREEAVGRNPRILKSGKQDEAFYRQLWQTISGGQSWQGQIVNKRKDGTVYTEEATISPVRDGAGSIVNYVGVKSDVTTQLALEEQYRQSQKMESIGRLAGGVAHDFNNMLGVILGHAELGLARMLPSQPLREHLEQIRSAATRSADLTRQLLAFARKQTIAPEVLDLNQTIEGMLKMLRRLIGEDIHMAWLPATGLWPVRIDPAQVDQVLANLCVNARDAIDGVGSVTIETRNVTVGKADLVSLEGQHTRHTGLAPGEYAVLSVTDNGCGMDGAVLEKIFEPFFTTKDVGRGTGLGLATVYGIIEQNEGFISVSSEPGKGTTFWVYLPRCAGETAEVGMAEDGNLPCGQGETVLVVEDEPAIRDMCKMMLEGLGYSVRVAGSPDEAMRLVDEQPGEIHLLVTDMVMPGMNGRDLAKRLQANRPAMRCLFMSGYTADAIDSRSLSDEGICFVQKPFTMDELAGAVRAALDGKRTTE